MRCAACGADNPEAAKFCIQCGAALAAICPACGHRNPPAARFCMECGSPLDGAAPQPRPRVPDHLAQRILSSRADIEGERKQVTALFCDLVNSTTLAERLGPEGIHTLLNHVFEIALSEVHRYEGTVNKFLGDGFLALFGVPLAHEDHARRAVLAALGIQRRLAEDSTVLLPRPSGNGHDGAALEVQVRMGLNTGLVVVGRIGDDLEMDYTAVGDTTNVAARLQQLAQPGEILIGESTARLVEDHAHLEPLGPVRVKGKREPVSPFRLLGLRPRRSALEGLDEQALSRFVGREQELAILRELMDRAAQGQGQVVGLVGEPGMGKSRLLYEFRRGLAGRRLTYLEGRCLSYGSTIPYVPVLDLLRHACGIDESERPDTIAGRVRSCLQQVGMDPAEWSPYLLRLLGVKEGTELLAGLSPEAIKARTFESFRQLLLHASGKRPLVLMVEDLHWIDRTSEQCFASLAETLAEAPILLLCTYRPGYRPPWIELPNATEIRLERLEPTESLSVVQSVRQDGQVPDSLAQLILDRAEGNPFFLEELTRAIGEQGDLQSESTVPDTVQGVLMARIDRLPGEPRRVLQTASVLGREFPLQLLEAIWEGPGETDPYLLELERLDFLREQSDGPGPVYVFKHALTQDVAYESLLTTRRQALHAAAGRALERLYAGRIEEAYDRLAYHYARTDEAAKAVEYLSSLADKAARAYAHAEAVAALREAMVHAERLPVEQREQRFLELVLQLAHSLYFLGGFPETLALLLEQRERVERLGDPALSCRYQFWLAHTYTYLGEQAEAAEAAQQAIDEAKQCGDEATQGRASYVLARVGFLSCRLVEGVSHGRRAVSLLEPLGERWWLGHSHWVVGMNYLVMGELERALEAEQQARAIGEAMGDPRLQTYAAWAIGLIRVHQCEWQAGIEASQRAIERSPDALNTAVALGIAGYGYLDQGNHVAALPLLEQSVQQLAQFRFRPVEGYFRAFLSECYLQQGQLERAREAALEGLTVTSSVGFGWGVGTAHRSLARIARATGALEEAEARFGEARQAFTAIGARFELARTHLDMAELAHARAKPAVVSAHLKQAREIFAALPVPAYLERTEQLAAQLSVSLA